LEVYALYSREIEAYKKKLKLSRQQREAVVGLLLGDAHLETQNGGRTYRLKIEYSVKKKEYCMHIYQLFKEWVLTPPREKQARNNGHQSVNIAFSTLSHGAFRFYAQQFYKEGKKVVPPIIKKLLTPIGLAYWFMDDGSIKSHESKGVIFNTQGFKNQDVDLLVEVLKSKWGLNAWKRKQKEGNQIYVSGYDLDKFLQLIGNLIHPIMRYKLPKARRT